MDAVLQPGNGAYGQFDEEAVMRKLMERYPMANYADVESTGNALMALTRRGQQQRLNPNLHKQQLPMTHQSNATT